MRERYRYLARAGMDFFASLLMQLTALVAALLIIRQDSLSSAAAFTLSLSICGPISLFAGMSVTELIFSNHKDYRRLPEIALAQLLIFLLASAVAGLMMAVFYRGYLGVFTLVSLTKLSDVMFLLCLNVLRREQRFSAILILGIIQFLCFCAAAALFAYADLAAPALELSIAMLLASLLQAGLAASLLRREIAADGWPRFFGALAFIRGNVSRSLAISFNSVQGNIPRLGLELMVSPQHQAIYSLLSTFIRIGTLLAQAAFVPVVRVFQAAFAKNPLRAVMMSSLGFFSMSVLAAAGLISAWFLAEYADLVHFLGHDINRLLLPADAVLILAASGVYLFRFGIWQLVSMLDKGGLQTRFALAGALITGAVTLLIVPVWGISGAALSEAAGNVFLVVAPILFWSRRYRRSPEGLGPQKTGT